MGDSRNALSTVGGKHAISAIGLLYLALAVARAVAVSTAGQPLAEAVIDFFLVGSPGVVLLYGAHRLSHSDIHSDVYSRVALWCLGGLGVMLGVVGLLALNPAGNVDRPLRAALIGTALGSVGGLAIGANEARAITRAREAERHEQEIQRKNQRLESFASMLAHELRNPLNVAQLYLDPATSGDEHAAEELGTALDRMEEMIDVLLVTARGSASDVDAEPVALSEVAADAWNDVAVPSADLVVETDRVILADPVHVRHLFENLFSNAIEHGTPTGELASDDGSPMVTIRVGELEGGFYVADDGPGISEEERDDVFEAGYTTDEDGIGLGLTVVAQLADVYDWECTLTDSEWGGARFEFRNVDLVPTAEC